jgi:hypothetical protein
VHETWHADQTAINVVGHGGRARRGGCAAGDTRGRDCVPVSWVLIIVQGMVPALTPDHFYASASDFGQTALQARHSGQAQRLAVDAATCLEHLAKACLAKRSPALLTELRNESNFASLLRLLDIEAGPPPRQLRTVGLRDALARVRVIGVVSRASERDLQTLVDLRDGVVHAAQDDEVEDQLLVAFVQHADALLQDLERDRAEFWAPQLAVVDALLVEAADKVERRVRVSIAAAKANFEQRWGRIDPGIVSAVKRLAPADPGPDGMLHACPVCGATGIADGMEFDWENESDELRGHGAPVGIVGFLPILFACGTCGLELWGAEELDAAGLGHEWVKEGTNPR